MATTLGARGKAGRRGRGRAERGARRLAGVIPWVMTGGALLAPSAQAADADGKFAVKGAARTTCERFVQARDESQEDTRPYMIYAAWLEGYLSALNERTAGTYDLTSFESTELLATLVYANCKRAPEEPFFNVVRRLVAALNETRLPAHSELVEVSGTVQDQAGEAREIELHLYEETVRRLQNNLKAGGFYSGAVDGNYGPGTREAMRGFQEANELRVTGLPDQYSLLKLFRRETDARQD